ncbi:short-chain dehydrogenase/reductase [Actinoplanes sp. NPDC049681]|uniref:short-chain dehydrogenase/reductase n=1 Tax=Actinoplanes sp. NPDC049681 TaxID=3363905 RepID=UPI0037A964C6
MTDLLARELAGKAVLVTGAARGIGAETARAAAARGARVALLGLEPRLLAALAEELGPQHAWFECDVTDQEALERAVAGAVAALGGIDVVIASAGITNNGTVAVDPVGALVRTIEVNLIGVVRTVSATLPHVAARRGYYLLVSSAAAFIVLPGMAAYGASKAGIEQFGNALRLEVAHLGVAVGTAHMVWVDTDMMRDVKEDLPMFGQMLSGLPRRLGLYTTPERCARAFLRGVARRSRRVYVPRYLAVAQLVRCTFGGAAADMALRRVAARTVPELEGQVRRLGRSFGRHTEALGE